MLNQTITIGSLELKNRLVMPPMHTGLSREGHVTDELIRYYYDRAFYSKPGLIITEHSCVTEGGRAARTQLSLGEDGMIAEHRRITDAIHDGGSRTFAQLNYAGSCMDADVAGDLASASAVCNPRRGDKGVPRVLNVEEIRTLQLRYVEAAQRALDAGYDGVEIHSAHSYLLDQFYSPLTNQRRDAYGYGSMEDRLRFLLEILEKVRGAIGSSVPLAVRLGGADYLPGGATEDDGVEAARLLSQAGIDLLDISGGMCGYIRPEHPEPGYFGSMSEKIHHAVSIPVMLTGGVKTIADAEQLLREEKADLIGVGRALFRDAHWAEHA